jgi:hypothetical protein
MQEKSIACFQLKFNTLDVWLRNVDLICTEKPSQTQGRDE